MVHLSNCRAAADIVATCGVLDYNTAMHEWALAEAVIESIRKELESRAVHSIDSVVLSLGSLQNVDEEIFKEGLEHFLTEDIPLDLQDIHCIVESAAFSCRHCGAAWELSRENGIGEEDLESIHFLPEASHSIIRCPDCNSPDFTIEKGRGVYIREINLREKG